MSRKNLRVRSAFTLIELMLSLTLIVLATGLIGYLMQMYARNFASRGDDVRRLQLSRAILNMVAEDIRAVVLEQKYDPSVLEQQLNAGSSQGGDASGGDTSAAGSGLASSQMPETDAGAPSADESGEMEVAVLPPGIYGDQFSLMIDVSRLPRPDEYLVQQASIVSGTLTDVPGDIKTVNYYVQSATNTGVVDEMSNFTSNAASSGYSSGLVRRALDRAVTAYAEEMGDSDRLMRTGDLVAPEVIAIEFAYFDGLESQWVYQWDSSTQSLPWLIQVSLAMQSASGSERAQIEPGTSISMMSFEDRRAYGIEVFELVVAIPGANLVAADAASEEQDAGMEAMGL